MFLRSLSALVLLLLSLANAGAHPHMWMRGSVSPILGARGLVAVDIFWTFDEFNSIRYITDFDSNGDGFFDYEETASIYQQSLAGLYQYEYYLIVDINGLRGTALPAESFTATINNNRLEYRFRVPLDITIRWEDMDAVSIYLFDPSYFIDFRWDEENSLIATWEDRTVEFGLARQELMTQGFGKVTITGLKAGYDADEGRDRLSVSAWIKDRSFIFQERLASYTRRVTGGNDPGAFWAAVGMALIFGMLHVMGPGHGKIFTLAYFSSRKARLSEGLLLSGLINILDSFSAFLLVGVTYGVLSLTIQSTGAAVGRITRIVAYSAITLIGIGYLLARFIGSGKHGSSKSRQLKPWMLALTVGLIPCPISSALLAYGMAQETIWFSLILVAGVSIGGMAALSLYSFLIIGGKAGLVRIAEYRDANRFLEWFEIASMVLLAAFGVVLLVTVL